MAALEGLIEHAIRGDPEVPPSLETPLLGPGAGVPAVRLTRATVEIQNIKINYQERASAELQVKNHFPPLSTYF